MKTNSRIPYAVVAWLALMQPVTGTAHSDPLGGGLVAHYPFNGNALDATEHGHDGFVINAVPATDRFGTPSSCYWFNGQNALIRLSDAIEFGGPQSNWTVCVWVRTTSTNNGTIVSDYWAAPDGNIDRRYSTFITLNWPPPVGPGRTGQVTAGCEAYPQSYLFTSDRAINDGQWHFLVYRAQHLALSLFIDGELEAGTRYDQALDFVERPHWTVGGMEGPPFAGWWPYLLFEGELDDLRLYDRGLSNDEIQALYLAAEPLPRIRIQQAVRLQFSDLLFGTTYQLQFSTDLTTWQNLGTPFTASEVAQPVYLDLPAQSGYFRVGRAQ